MEESLYSTRELVKEFKLTARTLRYYEEMNLLAPARQNNQRLFSKRDKTRLKLILRGKRFGLNLNQILEILGPANTYKSEKDQLEDAVRLGNECLNIIQEKRVEYEQLEKELVEYGKVCFTRLDKIQDTTEVVA